MTTLVVPTPRLDLVLQRPEEVLAWVASLPPEVQTELSPAWMDRVRSTPAGNPWVFSYAVVERATGSTVGGCAFKGPPDISGFVEIAYGIDPPYRSLGFATEVAEALTRFALASGRVLSVRAHTKRENDPSGRVLEKCGFHQVGQVVDPEDGLVIRWERGPAEDASPSPTTGPQAP